MSRDIQELRLTDPVCSGAATLVEASAGTGKTYNLARLYVKLLLEEQLEVRQILTVTFTNAATEELAVRIRELVRYMLALFTRAVDPGDEFDTYMLQTFAGREAEAAARLRTALGGIDEAAIYTIHAFCQRTLQQSAFESGSLFSLEPVSDESELLLDTARDYWRTHLYGAPPCVVSAVRATGYTPEKLVTLFELYRRNPGTVIEPDIADFDGLCGKLTGLVADLQREYPDAVREVRALIEDNKGLAKNKDTYNPQNLAVILSDLEAFVADGTLRSVKSLEMLTPGALEANRKPSEIKKGTLPPDHPVFALCLVAAGLLRDTAAAFCNQFLQQAEPALKQKMAVGRHMSYHDMLTDLYRALTSSFGGAAFVKSLQDKYKAALIDEFQDTDPVQYGIFDTVFSGRTVYYIGDPKQAIYRFRGADIHTYLRAANAVDRERTLGTNWRSSPGLVAAVNHVFSRSGAMAEEGIGYLPVQAGLKDTVCLDAPAAGDGSEAPLQFMFLPWEAQPRKKVRPKNAVDRDLLPFIAEEIKRLCRGGHTVAGKPLTPGDMAVLTRTGAQGLAIQRELRQHRINSVLLSNETVFDTREMAELLQILAAVAQPKDERLVRGAVLGGLWGMSPQQLEAMQADAAAWGTVMAQFAAWHALWERFGVMEVLTRFVAERKVADRLLACADGERRYANLVQSIEVLNNAAADGKRGAQELLQWIQACMDSPDTDKDYLQLRLESDADAVKVVTVHRSKGLEFPVVFCPDLWRTFDEDTLPLTYHKDGTVRLVTGECPAAETGMLLADRERLAEDLRLVYVALTRAKYRCYAADGPLADEYAVSALAWLLHRGDDAGEDPVAWLKAFKSRGVDSDALLADLHALAGSGAGIGVRMVENTVTTPPLEPAAAGSAGEALVRTVDDPGRLQAWRISSFSGLTAGQHRGVHAPEEVKGVEYDVPAAGQAAAGAVPAAGIFAFPKGAGPGSALHAVFENIDFKDLQPDALHTQVQRALTNYGIHDRYEGVAAKMVETVVSSKMPGNEGLCLNLLGTADRLTELEFVYPLQTLTADRLNTALEKIYPGAGGAGASEWSRLDFNPLYGYIRGFIDLVACWNGMYYILDWKSNHLGNRPEDYGQAQMRAAMQQHHYTLQYLLYTVALDRFLAGRIPGYSYETHFGGVYYVFLRGVTGSGDTGWYFDRPEAGVIEKLKGLLLG